jgi:hypothetical protein
MSNKNNNNGISSDFGFVYQRLVFVKEIIENCYNLDDSFTYEGVDDIEMEFGLYSIRHHNKLIQCKTGDIDSVVFDKAIMNWLLSDEKYDSYWIVSERDFSFPHSVSDVATRIAERAKAYLAEKKGRRKSGKSIMNQIIKKYFDEKKQSFLDVFQTDIQYVLSHYKKTVLDYDELRMESFDYYRINRCPEVKDNLTICRKRFETVLNRIKDRIDENESNRESTTITYSVFTTIINETTSLFSDSNYNCDYSDFKRGKLNSLSNNEKIMGSREAVFLKKVYGGNMRRVLDSLVQEYYYRDLKEYYASKGSLNKAKSAELVAYDHYSDTKPCSDLFAYFTDVISKHIGNEIIVNDSYNKGCYVYLSSDDCDDDVFIDWNEENVR